MSFPFLPAIDAPRHDAIQNGLEFKTLTHLGNVFTTVTPGTLNLALEFSQSILRDYGAQVAIHYDVTALSTLADILAILDAGAAKVFVSYPQLKEIEEVENIELDRIVLKIDSKQHQTREQVINAIGDTTVGIYSYQVTDVALLEDWLREYGSDRPPVYASLAESAADLAHEHYLTLIKLSAIPVIPSSTLTVDETRNPLNIPIHTLLNIQSDRLDELISTLVTDERGIALGLVYSTPQSIQESLKTGRGVYHSRKRGLWYKGESSGDIQELVRIQLDCDGDCLKFVVRQKGTATCFGHYNGLSRLQQTLVSRKASAPKDSYTGRLFSSPPLLRAKIMEEAQELCDATTKEDIAFEAADLIYFAMTKCIGAGVSLEDVERNLDAKSAKVKRRKGDAKGAWAEKEGLVDRAPASENQKETVKEAASIPKATGDSSGIIQGRIHMRRFKTSTTPPEVLTEVLKRPSQKSTDAIMGIVNPIVKSIRERGDAALLEYTHKFDKAISLTSPVLRSPYHESLMQLPPETIEAIDISFENIHRFHSGQKEDRPLIVETMPGVVCSRFSRPIERVGLYVPGGTAVLPSTALMLGVPALAAGCKKIVLASPPRADGSITPEIVYIAHKIGAESIVLAGGAQAVAALAYGTESVSKVDKILGPGNQFVTAAKMLVSNDTSAGVSIDMPAGPSEVLVIADSTANPIFVASDLLSQAEHGIDSQVILIAVDLNENQLAAIEEQLHMQANALPRVDIVRGAINHSVTLVAKDIHEAMMLSNHYAPEHLILQVQDAAAVVSMVDNAGSVFIGPWTPESVGDYSAGVNHSLPTYGYAKQYSGVNLASYVKHVTSSHLSAEGLRNVGPAVMQLAKVEQLEAHRRAVVVRLEAMDAGLAGTTKTATAGT
ncbi:MAG: trifunctional histidinol dehydrogenase [Sclerophora amabilis]|nr:MAG: trifunctional histidinol dehydrogenase [Sclerophora amabilis]